MQVARHQQVGNPSGTATTAYFFVIAEGQIHGAPGLGARRDQVLDGLEDRNEAAFVVERPTAPDVAGRDRATERRLGPLPLGPRLYRYDVLMGEEDRRCETGVGADPLVEEPIPVDPFELEGRVDLGEGLAEVPLAPLEPARLELRRVLVGDRLEFERTGEPLRERRRVERLGGDGRD